MWIDRPPTRMYWRRGWQTFFASAVSGCERRDAGPARRHGCRREPLHLRALAPARHRALADHVGLPAGGGDHLPAGLGLGAFRDGARHLEMYRTFVFGVPVQDFPVESLLAFVIFHGLVWASFLVIAGVMLAFRRRMIDHGAAATQQFAQDILPLLLLFAISVTGLMLTASYTWMRGYAYEFLAVLHAVTVIVTLLWLPFGKLFHVFQRPAQLGVSFYKDAGARGEQAACRRCGAGFASQMMVRDLIEVERELGFAYELPTAVIISRSVRNAGARCSDWPKEHCGNDPRRRTRDHRPLRTAPVGDDRRAAVDQRRAGAAGQDALLLLRPAVRHPAQGPRQRSDWLRAVGGVSVQSRHAVPEGREALPAGLASRSPADRAAARPGGGGRFRRDALRGCDRARPRRDRAAAERARRRRRSACSAAPA